MLWFNHATFFNTMTLDTALRETLLANFDKDDLPYNTYYGDGSPIESSVIQALRKAYLDETVSFPWKKGDVLMLDNMMVAHGRSPFKGPRRILVGLADPFCPD